MSAVALLFDFFRQPDTFAPWLTWTAIIDAVLICGLSIAARVRGKS